MEVIRAKRAGACYGVQRALDMADEVIADGSRAYTLGPLIHNPQVVADLAAAAPRPLVPWKISAGKVPQPGTRQRKGQLPQPGTCRRWSSVPMG